jgi:hypothetical protein
MRGILDLGPAVVPSPARPRLPIISYWQALRDLLLFTISMGMGRPWFWEDREEFHEFQTETTAFGSHSLDDPT